MPYAWTNGFRTWYETAGRSDGPPIVLMHGHTFDSSMWATQIPVLAERFRVVAFDVRGPARVRQMCLGYAGQGFRDPGRAQANDIAARTPLYERLAEISAPTLVVYGELDGPEVHAVGERAEREIPNVQRTLIAGAGHLSNMDEPVIYNRILLDFLERRAPSPQPLSQT